MPASVASQYVAMRMNLVDRAHAPRAVCCIDLDALVHNLAEVRRVVRPGVAICGVVKANAYGHGAVPVARALEAAGKIGRAHV